MEDQYLELHHDYMSYAKWHYEQYTLWSYYSWYLQHYIQYIRQRESDLAGYWTRNSGMNDPHFHPDDNQTIDRFDSYKADCYQSSMPFSNQKGHFSDSSTTTDHHNFKVPTPKKSKKKKKRRRRRKVSKTESEITEEEETDVEIDPAFKEFLRQSIQFKKERDAAKKRTGSSKHNDANEDSMIDDADSETDENTEYVDLMRKGPEGTILPPTATNRKELYDSRYGPKGTTILSLETALQWKFMQFSDQKSPILWPNLPLNL